MCGKTAKLKENTNMIEEWKPIKNYEGLYEVSNFGRVKSLERYRISGRYKINMKYKEHILKPGKNGKGYLKLDLCKNGETKTHVVHRLVLSTFLGKSDLEGNHKDGIKENNRLDNLEYMTRSENQIHAYRMGLQSKKGEKHHYAKLNNEIVKNIRENKFNLSLKEFAACYDVSVPAIDPPAGI